MKLLTKEILAALIKQGNVSNKLPKDIRIIFKLFGGSSFTWWIYSQDEENPDILYAFCNLGDPQMAEYGPVSLNELKALRFKPFGLGLERDLFFRIGQKTLQDVIDEVKGKRD